MSTDFRAGLQRRSTTRLSQRIFSTNNCPVGQQRLRRCTFICGLRGRSTRIKMIVSCFIDSLNLPSFYFGIDHLETIWHCSCTLNNIFFNFVIAQVISVPTDSGYHLPAGRQQEPGKIADEMIAQLKDKIESMPEKKNTAKDSRRLQILCEEAKRNEFPLPVGESSERMQDCFGFCLVDNSDL